MRSLFHSVLSTASSPALTAAHCVAAWNALSALLDACVAASQPAVHDLLWKGGLWAQTFDLFVSQGHLARPKSSRQLLATLTSALHKRGQSVESDRLLAVRLLDGLALDDDPGKAKTCALALGNFLSKDVVTLGAVLVACEPYQSQSALSSVQQPKLEFLLYLLFTWIGKGDFGSTIAQVVAAVLDRVILLRRGSLEGIAHGSRQTSWMPALRRAAAAHDLHIDDLRVHLLPVLFKRSTLEYLVFLTSLGLGKDSPTAEADQELLYASLQAGKDLGLLQESPQATITNNDGIVSLPISWINTMLVRNSRSARLTGLSLLISSPGATKPILLDSFRSIKRSLNHLFADTDANFRGEVSGMIQRLVIRVRAASAVLARQKWTDPTAEVKLHHHQQFLNWLMRFTIWELRSTASYQRHVSGLKCLSTLVRSGLDDTVPLSHLSKSALIETRWPFVVKVMGPPIQRLLLDLVCDPFEDVRQMAASILGIYATTFDSSSWRRIEAAMSRAEEVMLATGRADQADGVAHLYTLLCARSGSNVLPGLVEKLENMLEIAKKDLAQAVERYPVHGLLTSIRYILSRRLAISSEPDLPLDRLVVCLHDVWCVVKPSLCNDAPEGYLPEAMEETSDMSTKDTLSYCWRALKEASLLLGCLLVVRPHSDDEGQREHNQRFRSLCELCFTQLAELRHRGAFSTVAQTWIACCMHSDRISEPGRYALQEAYERALLILRNKTTINTRRSAGLPSLICGILVADQSGVLIKTAFKDLWAIALQPVPANSAQEGSLPQVHAMNCIKDVLKNSRLGERSNRYVPKALKLAADALRSEAWAVRNCGLMLFRAVIDRLLGTSDASLDQDTSARKKISIEQHPQLLGIVLELLESPTTTAGSDSSSGSGNEGVFPALQLLQRIILPAEHEHRTRHAVKYLMASEVWHVRDKAARTYASLISSSDFAIEVHSLLQTSWASQNELHGALLGIKYMLELLYDSLHGPGQSADVRSAALHQAIKSALQAQELFNICGCPLVQAAYLDVVQTLISTCQKDGRTAFFSNNGSVPQAVDIDLSAFLDVKASVLQWTCYSAPNAIARNAILPSLAALYAAHTACMSEFTDVQHQETSLMISEMAERDPTASIKFLQRLQGDALSSNGRHVKLMIQICAAILEKASAKPGAKMAATKALLHVAANDNDSFVTHARNHLQRPLQQATATWANQRYADMCLQLQSVYIDCLAKHDGSQIMQLHREIEAWALSVCRAVNGDNFFSSEAAALSLVRVKHLWTPLSLSTEISGTVLELCFAIYDLLTDDDEDTRVLAAEAASHVLCAFGECKEDSDIVPLVASRRMIDFTLRQWHGNNFMIDEVSKRALGLNALDGQSVGERLKAATKVDTALFVEEKQNLYIDEAWEVKMWSNAMLRIPAHCFSKSLLKHLSSWVADGLTALATKNEDSPDGALGWTSKAEVFTLGLQVVYGAEVLLRCVQQGVKIETPPSMLRKSLAELQASDERNSLNGLWLQEIARVLSQSVAVKLEAAFAGLVHLQKAKETSAPPEAELQSASEDSIFPR